jgi:hypothetical protein
MNTAFKSILQLPPRRVLLAAGVQLAGTLTAYWLGTQADFGPCMRATWMISLAGLVALGVGALLTIGRWLRNPLPEMPFAEAGMVLYAGALFCMNSFRIPENLGTVVLLVPFIVCVSVWVNRRKWLLALGSLLFFLGTVYALGYNSTHWSGGVGYSGGYVH